MKKRRKKNKTVVETTRTRKNSQKLPVQSQSRRSRRKLEYLESFHSLSSIQALIVFITPQLFQCRSVRESTADQWGHSSTPAPTARSRLLPSRLTRTRRSGSVACALSPMGARESLKWPDRLAVLVATGDLEAWPVWVVWAVWAVDVGGVAVVDVAVGLVVVGLEVGVVVEVGVDVDAEVGVPVGVVEGSMECRCLQWLCVSRLLLYLSLLFVWIFNYLYLFCFCSICIAKNIIT